MGDEGVMAASIAITICYWKTYQINFEFAIVDRYDRGYKEGKFEILQLRLKEIQISKQCDSNESTKV